MPYIRRWRRYAVVLQSVTDEMPRLNEAFFFCAYAVFVKFSAISLLVDYVHRVITQFSLLAVCVIGLFSLHPERMNESIWGLGRANEWIHAKYSYYCILWSWESYPRLDIRRGE
jgi:hypothetical protein